jgi:hypothetical protein
LKDARRKSGAAYFFPEPFSPTIQNVSPRPTSNVKSRSAQ